MKNKLIILFSLQVACYITLISCEEYVELESPNYIISNENVFNNDETAQSSIQGIYNQLAIADFSSGYNYSTTILAGLSSDILETTSITDLRYGPFHQNQINSHSSEDAVANYNLWSSFYNILYMANSIIEGVDKSTQISEDIGKKVKGQALFIRAFIYFYLINTYGDVPLVLGTEYSQNMTKKRESSTRIYQQIISDLSSSGKLLDNQKDFPSSERTKITFFTVLALNARVNLYIKNWAKAEELSSKVISNTKDFQILNNLDDVFLMNSREAIWQISPLGRGSSTTYTREGYIFRGNNSSDLKLSENFITELNAEDRRTNQWIGYNLEKGFYYPQKYKDGYSRGSITEYSMVLRLAEQYLIRAEARVMLDNYEGAVKDLNVLRKRSGLEVLQLSNFPKGKEEIIDSIVKERKMEFFSEWGHRWFDLKRTGRATVVLPQIKPMWQDTDVLYPIPEEERLKQPGLSQNPGY